MKLAACEATERASAQLQAELSRERAESQRLRELCRELDGKAEAATAETSRWQQLVKAQESKVAALANDAGELQQVSQRDMVAATQRETQLRQATQTLQK